MGHIETRTPMASDIIVVGGRGATVLSISCLTQLPV
jgi:hypothetical protein